MKNVLLFIILLLASLVVNAQRISGRIIDEQDKFSLEGCNLIINSSNSFNKIVSSDSLGMFTLDLYPGIFSIETQYLGYKKHKFVFEIQREEEFIHNIALIIDTFALINPTITTTAIKNTQEISLDKDLFMRLPGAFNDPSRLLVRFPGISATNDQANQITVKGLPPHASAWFLNGASIVNPNHLSNAGTFSDQASASGGGVNMFSGTSIEKYSFYSAPFNHRYYDAPAGISDFKLSIPTGIRYSLGLLGTELSYAKENKKNTYLGVNYRYSTLGILSALGVQLGDEEISFQDLHIRLGKTLNLHSIELNIVGGLNRNFHGSLGEESVITKDALNIDFKGNQFVSSLNHQYRGSSLSNFNTINYSFRNNNRTVIKDVDILAYYDLDREDKLLESTVAMTNQFNFLLKNNVALELINQTSFKSLSILENNLNTFQQYNILQARYLWKRLNIQGGFGYSHFANAFFNPEIRFLTKYTSGFNNFQFKYAHQSNSIIPQLLILDNNLEPFQSGNYSIDYFFDKMNHFFQLGLFYHQYNSILVSEENYISYFDRIDLVINELENNNLSSNGRGTILGFQEQFEYLFKNNYQFLQSFSWYDMNITDGEKDIQSTYDFGYTYALTFSYNQQIKEKARILYSAGLQGRGAAYDFFIDKDASSNSLVTIYSSEVDKTAILNPYFRIDLKVDYIFGKGLRHRLSIDIQNLFNRKNDAFQFYDPLTDNVLLQNQLGIIPILKFSSQINTK